MENAAEWLSGKYPSTYLKNNKGKVLGVIPFKNEDEYKKYVNDDIEKQQIDFSKSSWENKTITLK